MVNDLARLLVRAEHLRDGVFTPEDVRAWPRERWSDFEVLGIIEADGRADEIVYDGCDRECTIPNTGFQKHPADPERLVCVHRCLHGCGRVILEPQDFEQWRLNMVGLTTAVRDAIGASGAVVEDVPGRIALAGTASVAGQTGEVFVGFGLARPDAAGVAASASRLVASERPFVLSIGVKPGNIWSVGNRPTTAVLAEHAHLSPNGLALDLARVFPASGLVEIKPEAWITVTAAAKLLLADVSGIDLDKARARVSKAATEHRFRTNGKSGQNRRIDRDSFSTWRLEQREKDLAKDDSYL